LIAFEVFFFFLCFGIHYTSVVVFLSARVMEFSIDRDKNLLMVVPETRIKTKQFEKVYVRRKSIKLPQNSVIFPHEIKDRGEEESKEKEFFHQGKQNL